MSALLRFNPSTHVVGISRDMDARLVPEQPDPPVPVNGMTFGVATMSENAPHGGEMHPDGDEILYLAAGRVRVVLETDPVENIMLGPGDGCVVPRGTWHRVEILEPSKIVYMTPGPNNQFRELPG